MIERLTSNMHVRAFNLPKNIHCFQMLE